MRNSHVQQRRRRWHPTPVLLPGKSHGWKSLVGYSPWGRKESDTTERAHFHFSFSCIAEGNGNPLQCSCLENPGDGGAWWAIVYGVAQESVTTEATAAAAAATKQQPAARTLSSHCWGPRLIRELKFHKLHSTAKKKKERKNVLMATLSQCLSPGLYNTHFLHSMSLLYHLVIWNEIIQGPRYLKILLPVFPALGSRKRGWISPATRIRW